MLMFACMHLHRFEIDERYADELEELKTEKEAGQPAKEDNVSDTAAVTNITEEESKEGEASGGRSNDQSAPITPEPVSPEVAALLAEKENVMKNLKASLAELDNETRKRKKEQDLLVRDAKAAIDKEIDQLKEGARKKADEKIAEIDATLGMTLNGKSSELWMRTNKTVILNHPQILLWYIIHAPHTYSLICVQCRVHVPNHTDY